MEFYEAYYAQERDTMPATIGVRLLKATEVHREECPASRYQEAMGRYRALAQEDGPLARYLWPQLKKGIEYLRKSGRGAHLLPPGWREPSGSIEAGPSLWMVLRRIVGRRTSTIYGWQRKEPRRMVRTGYARL